MANHFKDPDKPDTSASPEPFETLRAEPARETRRNEGSRGGKNRGPSGGRRRKKPWYRAPLIALASIAVLAAGIYAAGVYAFSGICYPGTTIAGVDVSLMSKETACARISSALVNYSLTVSYGEFEWSYDPDSSSDILDAEATFERIVASNEPERWPQRLYEALVGDDDAESEIEVETIEFPSSFDTEAFEASVAEAVTSYNEGRSGTFDKQSAYDEELGLFTVEQARSNQLLDAEAVAEAALVGLATLSRTVELDESHTVAIANGATDEELQAICDAANELIASDITLTMGGVEVASIDGSDLLEWLTLDDEINFSVDAEAVEEWAEDLADEVDTVGTRRVYTRADGEQIAVSGGTYGWAVDAEAFAEALTAAIAAGETTTLEIPTSQSGDVYATDGEPDWTAYIDVDISEQYARYYDADGTVIWESGVITGNTTKGYDTPTGIYYVVTKLRDVTLYGELQSDGSYSYETPVSYWMAFIGGSIGFHDATWQSESNFGVAGANTWTGSHGCVNLPLAAAAELYDLVEVGLCVIVHD